VAVTRLLATKAGQRNILLQNLWKITQKNCVQSFHEPLSLRQKVNIDHHENPPELFRNTRLITPSFNRWCLNTPTLPIKTPTQLSFRTGRGRSRFYWPDALPEALETPSAL